MDVYIDDVKADLALNADQPLDALLQAGRRAVGLHGRMIVGLVCDGIDITDEALPATLQQSQSDFNRVDMTSADPTQLVQDALDQAEKLLDETADSAEGIVEQLTCGKQAEAMPVLGSCCQSWLQIHSGIANAINALRIDPADVMVDGKPLVDVLADPIQVLNGIKESVTAQDFVSLSDILSYEYGEAVNGWRGIIDAVRQIAANGEHAFSEVVGE